MVTSVCSKREWTHLTLADSWWKPLTGNSFESYIWMFDLHPEHPELSCSKTKTCRGAVLCYRALPPRWPPVGSTTLWKRSCSSCRNPRTNAPTSGSPDQIQCHHRKHCTRRTLANLGLQLVRRAQNHAHRKRNNTVHWKNMKNYFLYLIRLQYVVVWISQTKIFHASFCTKASNQCSYQPTFWFCPRQGPQSLFRWCSVREQNY